MQILSKKFISEKCSLIDETHPELNIFRRSEKVRNFLCGLERNMEEGFTAKEYGDFLGISNIYGRRLGNPLFDAAIILGVSYDSLLEGYRLSPCTSGRVYKREERGKSSMDEKKTMYDITAEKLLMEKNPSWTSLCKKYNCSKEELQLSISAMLWEKAFIKKFRETLDANEKKRKGEKTMAQNEQKTTTATATKKATKPALPSPIERIEELEKKCQEYIEEIKLTKKDIKQKMDEIDEAGKEIDDLKAKLGGHKKQLAEFQRKANRQETNLKKYMDEIEEFRKGLAKPIEVEISVEHTTFKAKDGSPISTAGDEKIFKSYRSRQEIDDKFNGREIRIASKMKAIRQNAAENEIVFSFIDGDKTTQNRIIELYQK